MFRTVSVLLLLIIISTISLDECLGQTFQYSRGWTNGKRSNGILENYNQQQQQQQHLPRYLQKEDSVMSPSLYDDRFLDKCIVHMRNLLGRTALYTGALSLKPTPANSISSGNGDNSHHQSSEIFDDLNGLEANEYAKH